ncbi:Nucleoside-diphosphate-sugar epimerase [Erythrobacter litoralis]|uniref:Epimerase n=1 Tax=Erythrobacter litoralis TaxID=39960 RepID=A0A074MNK4_9SPHN|nr:NAD(P)H-binding protein [Erythrobacter litoralis]AOL24324.1 Nucleoside-diphosphate-sugar epimerase [Erythrobacter litoralis]KEO93433.1 epimerase [Erythrobacter litoralis]
MKALALTGATGFVGSAVLDEALAKGRSVRALTRREQGPRAGVEWIAGTLSDPEALAGLCEGADAVIHVAGLTNTPDPAEFEAANAVGTSTMIGAAKRAGARRFVFVSSLSAREPKLSAYGASKARAEALVEASGLDWTIVRPPAVYGPRDADMFELFRSAKLGVVPLPPGGATSIIHVADLACLLVALAGDKGAKAIYEPDDGREGGWAHKELAQAIGRAVGRRSVFAPHLPRTVLDMAARADRMLRGDGAKLTADRVGYMAHPNWVARSDRRVPREIWEPRIGGEEGLKATAEWYRKQGWL